MKEFYISLISNSSLEIYPRNKASSFIVQLPHKITLTDDWVVGLAEIQFPYNFFNVSEGNNTLTYTNGFQIIHRSIENGFYKSVSELVGAVREKTKDFGDDWIHFDSRTNRVRIKPLKAISDEVQSTSNRSIQFHGLLALQLGFAPDTDVLKYDLSPYIGNVYFGIPDQTFLYCDLIEPQLIGYDSTQVLKIINTTQRKANFGTSCYHGFQKNTLRATVEKGV